MTVKQNADGSYGVFASAGAMQPIAGPFANSSAAWRWIDRQTGQAVSRAEDVGQWAWDRSVDRRFGQ